MFIISLSLSLCMSLPVSTLQCTSSLCAKGACTGSLSEYVAVSIPFPQICSLAGPAVAYLVHTVVHCPIYSVLSVSVRWLFDGACLLALVFSFCPLGWPLFTGQPTTE